MVWKDSFRVAFVISTGRVIVVFLLVLLNFLANELNVVRGRATGSLAGFLLCVVSPYLVIGTCLINFSVGELVRFFRTVITIALICDIDVVISRLVVGGGFFGSRRAHSILLCNSTCSGTKFVNVPLISTVLNRDTIFFSIPCLIIYGFFV